MNPGYYRLGSILVLAVLLLLTISTPVELTDGGWNRSSLTQTELMSSSSSSNDFKCSNSEFAETSMGQYFELRKAVHFYKVIDAAVNSLEQREQRISNVSALLDGINRELLKTESEQDSRSLEAWILAYPGSEEFKIGESRSGGYDLQAFYFFVEKDVHHFFYNLLRETLLPENLWIVKEHKSRSDSGIQSLGVRLGKNTWARLGLFPKQWHLHIFKSPAVDEESRPQDHFPLQGLSLRMWSLDKYEILDGGGKIRLKVNAPEELEIVPYCEWLAGEGRRDQQLTRKVLRNL